MTPKKTLILTLIIFAILMATYIVTQSKVLAIVWMWVSFALVYMIINYDDESH